MLDVQDLILRTQSELNTLKQRTVELARMWEERKHSTGSPRADRALVLMEVARDASLAAGVIQQIKMALDAKEFIDLLVKFRFVETVDDEGAARDFLARQPKEKVEEFAARFFNVFKVTTNTYGGVFLDRSGRPLLVEGPRLVEFVKWFVGQLLLEKEADEGVKCFKGLEDGTIAPPEWKPRPDVPERVTAEAENTFPDSTLTDAEVTPGGVYRKLPNVPTFEHAIYHTRTLHGTYVGADSVLRGERATIRIGVKGILAQFDNSDLELSRGWHAFDTVDFEIDESEDEENRAS
jgi:hypothetical protein